MRVTVMNRAASVEPAQVKSGFERNARESKESKESKEFLEIGAQPPQGTILALSAPDC